MAASRGRDGRLSYAVVARLLRDVALPAAALVLLVAAALVLPLRPHGDAGEYLLMLESWHRHGSPELAAGRPSSRCAGCSRSAGLAIDESRVLPNYHAADGGRLYCYHFWAYSLAGLPARALLERRPCGLLAAAGAAGHERARLRPRAGRGRLLPWTGSRRLWLGGLLLLLARPRVPDVAAPRGLHASPS